MLASEQLRIEANEVTSGNTTYTTYQPIWQYYLESYMGGEDYRRAEHLTRYQLETDREYAARLRNTPLENHCKSIISVYVSFLFRQTPDRDFGSMGYMPELDSILEDADYEGRSMDSFMKQVAVWSNVFGHAWVLVSKPNIGAITRADEQAAGLRPYLCVITPLAVLDWRYARDPVGRYQLTYFKYLEDVNGDVKTVKEWTATEIKTTTVDDSKKKIINQELAPNQLGMIPAVCAYSTRSPQRGIGISSIGDIADAQRYIYNATSEMDQSIRLDSHPSLVIGDEVNVSSGAGGVIQMPNGMDPALKPYVLDFGGANVGNILEVIRHTTQTIDKLANTGAIRTTETRTASGIAIQTEFELLNARLSELADSLELCEEEIWQIIAQYQGYTWDGEIHYPDSFNIRDDANELEKLNRAKAIATDPAILTAIDHELVELMDLDLGEDIAYEQHPEEDEMVPTTEANRIPHIQQMIMDGLEDQQILELHPEISASDITEAKARLLN